MKKIIHIAFGFAAVTGLTLYSCQPTENNLAYESDSLKLPTQTLNYTLPTATETHGIDYKSNPSNPITNDGATLGRVLFYDKKLSLNNQVACASCHHQSSAFADPVKVSTGFQGMKTTRNASTLVNPILETHLFWDMRSPNLEDLALRPVRNHIEMGIEDMDKLSTKLAKITYYPELFEKSFGSKDINGDRIAKAIAQFLGSMVTYQSKFDAGKANNFANFTAQENRGRLLFMKELHCANCHGGANFNTPSLKGDEEGANIGLDVIYSDNGLGARTGDKTKNGIFKIPSLRNIALTAPYMHDGRFANLERVIDHYNSMMQNHENLQPNFRTFTWSGNTSLGSGGGWGASNTSSAPPRSLLLNESDKAALVAFLKTLTDEKLIKDERFSNPFRS
jgi:cytochrome c peroxidase